ncbi:hypothetical protein TIFTF001_032025 [Ficus carica]|uniref:Uncharacterized protein n=1 Tax=Ficus carica TaxID=3494 RepID=A0AA88DW89_FICCA|nr:hypothetical protein TIFTF001_031983 [Ficus carica]GMN62945.1 hypothetical protein TIFTF001_032025 [Ficus carica]
MPQGGVQCNHLGLSIVPSPEETGWLGLAGTSDS